MMLMRIKEEKKMFHEKWQQIENIISENLISWSPTANSGITKFG